MNLNKNVNYEVWALGYDTDFNATDYEQYFKTFDNAHDANDYVRHIFDLFEDKSLVFSTPVVPEHVEIRVEKRAISDDSLLDITSHMLF